MKKKNEVSKVAIMSLSDILDDIIGERNINYFGHCVSTFDVKNNKFIATIKNDKSIINISIDMNDVCKRYTFKNWKYINLLENYWDDDILIPDRNSYEPSVMFW